MFKYDVALSYASEERDYVQKVANELVKNDVKVFYDMFEQADLWGKNLYSHLREVYKDTSEYTIIFCSKNYSKKQWTSLERESAQARAFKESKEYILPARFDDTEIPGILDTTGYIDLNSVNHVEFTKLILKKLNKKEIIKTSKNQIKTNFEEKALLYDICIFIGKLEESLHNLISLVTNEQKHHTDYIDNVFYKFSSYSKEIIGYQNNILGKLPESFFDKLSESGVESYKNIHELEHVYSNLYILMGNFTDCNRTMYLAFTGDYKYRKKFYKKNIKKINNKIELASELKLLVLNILEES